MNLKTDIHPCRLYSIMICSLICGSLAGCGLAGDPAEPSERISLRNDRLRFADLQAFVDTMGELSAIPADDLALDYFETRFAGFEALRSTGQDVPEMASSMRVVLNQDGVYQIGDRIYLLLGDSEYLIPESEERLVAALLHGASPAEYAAAGRIEIRRVERTTLDDVSRGESPTSQGLLNAKYQSQFGAAGHTYKFVHEAYVDRFTHYLTACFRAKFEYKDGSGFRTAGERVYKEITSATVSYDLTPMTTSLTTSPISGVRNDSSHLTICTQVTPPVGGCVAKPKLSADQYYSEGTATHIIGRVYSHAASWTSEFTSLGVCN